VEHRKLAIGLGEITLEPGYPLDHLSPGLLTWLSLELVDLHTVLFSGYLDPDLIRVG
jgi:hypothetical protein